MATYVSVGSGTNSVAAGDDTLSIVVRSGDTVTLKNSTNSTGTINYISKGFCNGVTGTVAANASTSLTQVGTH
jgi:hypothetical protein